jgi:hypothetical protein
MMELKLYKKNIDSKKEKEKSRWRKEKLFQWIVFGEK